MYFYLLLRSELISEQKFYSLKIFSSPVIILISKFTVIMREMMSYLYYCNEFFSKNINDNNISQDFSSSLRTKNLKRS